MYIYIYEGSLILILHDIVCIHFNFVSANTELLNNV